METPVAEEVTVPTTIPEAFLALAKEARGALIFRCCVR
jgi:hypothetical protein